MLTLLFFVLKIILGLLVFVLSYFGLALLLSVIPVNRKYKNTKDGIPIYIASNGIHTDFILPMVHDLKNWWELLDSKDFGDDKSALKYVAFGWGDRGFYLDLPSWDDMTLKAAVNAVILPGPSLMHVKTYTKLQKYTDFECLYLNKKQYRDLCNYIVFYFEMKNGQVEIVNPRPGNYEANENFYYAKDAYHAINTCNYWVNRGLRKIGIRTCVWSPLDKGIFYQLRRI